MRTPTENQGVVDKTGRRQWLLLVLEDGPMIVSVVSCDRESVVRLLENLGLVAKSSTVRAAA